MASICKDPNGKKRIVFTSPDGVRKALWLGKMTVKQAESVRQKVERIIAAKITRTALDDDTAKWIAKLDDSLAKKLSKAGLIEQKNSTLLKAFLDSYIKSRSDIKESTKTVLGHTKRNLITFFGENKPLREISQGDAERFRLFLIEEGLADNTVRRRCGIAKQYFNQTIKDEIINRNPFAGLVSTVRGNAEREYFVTREESDKVIDAAPASHRRSVALRWLTLSVRAFIPEMGRRALERE